MGRSCSGCCILRIVRTMRIVGFVRFARVSFVSCLVRQRMVRGMRVFEVRDVHGGPCSELCCAQCVQCVRSVYAVCACAPSYAFFRLTRMLVQRTQCAARSAEGIVVHVAPLACIGACICSCSRPFRCSFSSAPRSVYGSACLRERS